MTEKRKEYLRKYQRAWLAGRRATFFSDKYCVNCGSTDRLELDHIDPALKLDHKIWAWRAVRQAEEIAKCQVLCNACHKKKTAEYLGRFVTHGMRSMYMLRGCRCESCVSVASVYRNANKAKHKNSPCLRSSVVEQRTRNAQAVSSNLTDG